METRKQVKAGAKALAERRKEIIEREAWAFTKYACSAKTNDTGIDGGRLSFEIFLKVFALNNRFIWWKVTMQQYRFSSFQKASPSRIRRLRLWVLQVFPKGNWGPISIDPFVRASKLDHAWFGAFLSRIYTVWPLFYDRLLHRVLNENTYRRN